VPTYTIDHVVTVDGYAHGSPWNGFATPRATHAAWRACIEAVPTEHRAAILESLDSDPYATNPTLGPTTAQSVGLMWMRVS
jgi:hypothetical protein